MFLLSFSHRIHWFTFKLWLLVPTWSNPCFVLWAVLVMWLLLNLKIPSLLNYSNMKWNFHCFAYFCVCSSTSILKWLKFNPHNQNHILHHKYQVEAVHNYYIDILTIFVEAYLNCQSCRSYRSFMFLGIYSTLRVHSYTCIIEFDILVILYLCTMYDQFLSNIWLDLELWNLFEI